MTQSCKGREAQCRAPFGIVWVCLTDEANARSFGASSYDFSTLQAEHTIWGLTVVWYDLSLRLNTWQSKQGQRQDSGVHLHDNIDEIV